MAWGDQQQDRNLQKKQNISSETNTAHNTGRKKRFLADVMPGSLKEIH